MMKKSLAPILFICLSFIGTSSLAANNCATLKRNAKKAGNLYMANKKKAMVLGKRVNVLKKDQKRMPANISLAKRLVNHEIYKLSEVKKKRIETSLIFLEKHIRMMKAAKKSCNKKRVRRFKPKVLMTVADTQ